MYGIPDNPSPSPEFSPSPRPPGQSPTPPPSPAASRSMLALISDFYTKPSESGPADSYRGKSANLTATLLSDFTVKCSKAPSRIRGNNGTSLAAPEIWCTDNGEKKMPPGKYSLTYSEPPFVGFKQWRCDDFGDGNSAEPVLVDKADWSFTLKGNVRVVCVAEFTMD
ncbi:hypothetical protein OEZ85_012742 [Tetradesmus obliquus]|uniref:Uncharacterized protein n=1 Tax=Tetradesmus obliquus TaxID=3088 RepID=A0ABY8U4H7_TETOB|nr:hypothetical protein OEZ85_012742 [Tetradesmus obliquus]